MNAREVALDLLRLWSRTRLFADELLDEHKAFTNLSAADRALAAELFYGCVRHKIALEWLLDRLAPRKPRPIVAAILDVGLYQIVFLTKIPPHAAVNETVALAKRLAHHEEVRFVNAVLRGTLRKKETLLSQFAAARETEPWVFYSHPRWLWDRWQARWGRENALALCAWDNQPPPIYIRANTLKAMEGRAASRPRIATASASQEFAPPQGIAAEPSPFHPLSWRVTDATGLFQSKSWADGEYYAQDPSTLVAVDVLDPQPGESILDMCAAPGGKTTYIAQMMLNRGRIIAADSSNARLGLVAENCQRLGVTIVATLPCEGTRLDRCLRGDQFDRVLVDAPCSNTGVLRRRVDLRWRIEEKEIARLAALQQRLLRSAAGFVKPSGVLVYSTCSLETEENERVVEKFCGSQSQFTLESTRSIFPPRDSVDGAFVARFVRKK